MLPLVERNVLAVSVFSMILKRVRTRKALTNKQYHCVEQAFQVLRSKAGLMSSTVVSSTLYKCWDRRCGLMSSSTISSKLYKC